MLHTSIYLDSCQFYYLVQPPSNLSCNPFLDNARYSARIECVVAVNRNIGGTQSDFTISWFGQHGPSSEPQELFVNGMFGTELKHPIEITKAFYIYQSNARVKSEIGVLDRFWCQVRSSMQFLNDTELDRSDEIVLSTWEFYHDLPLCRQQTFFHKTELKCAVHQFQPTIKSKSAIVPPSPTKCLPSQSNKDNTNVKRLMGVLFPSLILPIFVASLLFLSALLMSCRRRSRKKARNQTKKEGMYVSKKLYTFFFHTLLWQKNPF